MKEKITGIISFLSAIGWGLYAVIEFFYYYDGDELLWLFAFLLSAISIIMYIVWTKLGKKEFTELDKIDYEIKLLKRQIERKDLKKKLED